MLFGNLDHRLHTFRTHEHLVKTEEGVLQGLPKVFLGLKFRLLSQFALEKLFAEFGTFEASVPVKNSEEAYALLVVVCVSDVGVFHIESPPLHG
jgi:hypothetical protein